MSNPKDGNKDRSLETCAENRKAMRHLSHEVVVLAGTLDELCSDTIPAGLQRLAGVEQDLEALNGSTNALRAENDELRPAIDTLAARQTAQADALAAHGKQLSSLADALDELREETIPAEARKLEAIDGRLDTFAASLDVAQSRSDALRPIVDAIAANQAAEADALAAHGQRLSSLADALDEQRDETRVLETERLAGLEQRLQILAASTTAQRAATEELRPVIDTVAANQAAQADALAAHGERLSFLADALDELRDGVIPAGHERLERIDERLEILTGSMSSQRDETNVLRPVIDTVAANQAAQADALAAHGERLSFLADALDELRDGVIPAGDERLERIDERLEILTGSMSSQRAATEELRPIIDAVATNQVAQADALAAHGERLSSLPAGVDALRAATEELRPAIEAVKSAQAEQADALAVNTDRVFALVDRLADLSSVIDLIHGLAGRIAVLEDAALRAGRPKESSASDSPGASGSDGPRSSRDSARLSTPSAHAASCGSAEAETNTPFADGTDSTDETHGRLPQLVGASTSAISGLYADGPPEQSSPKGRFRRAKR